MSVPLSILEKGLIPFLAYLNIFVNPKGQRNLDYCIFVCIKRSFACSELGFQEFCPSNSRQPGRWRIHSEPTSKQTNFENISRKRNDFAFRSYRPSHAIVQIDHCCSLSWSFSFHLQTNQQTNLKILGSKGIGTQNDLSLGVNLIRNELSVDRIFRVLLCADVPSENK